MMRMILWSVLCFVVVSGFYGCEMNCFGVCFGVVERLMLKMFWIVVLVFGWMKWLNIGWVVLSDFVLFNLFVVVVLSDSDLWFGLVCVVWFNSVLSSLCVMYIVCCVGLCFWLICCWVCCGLMRWVVMVIY